MNHFWKTIPGFFTFPAFYSWLARSAFDVQHVPVHGVEIGVYAGQSVAYLAVEVLNTGARLLGQAAPWHIDMVDTFDGGVQTVIDALAPVKEVIGTAHVGRSWDMASRYEDGSLDWIFIDADHAYESVRKDIDAWLPKVRKGGIVSGHDYTCWPGFGVIQAVTETFARVEVWRGDLHMGDTAMQAHYWPVWCVKL